MRRKFIVAVLVAAVALTAGISCGGKKKRAGLQDRAVLPDKTLFQNGMEFLARYQFIKARLSFQTLINTYDDSEYLEKAKYYIAYSYLREGGIENLIQAEQAFKDFRLFFPTSPWAPIAQAYVVKINMRMMQEPNRDITYARKSHVELKGFLQEFPDSDLTKEMQLRLQFVENTLAESSFLKGQFYFGRKRFKAAASRLKDCVQGYRTYRKRDEALFLLAESYGHLKNFDDSALYYSQLVRGFPFSEYFEKSKERLRKLEKAVPEVDQKLAEENRLYYRQDDPFFKSILGTFGIGTDQPWEELEKKRDQIENARIREYRPSKGKKKDEKARASEAVTSEKGGK